MSKLDKIKKDNPELNISIIDMIQAMDPSTTNKYCEFLIKMIKNHGMNQEIIIKSVMDTLFGIDQIDKLHKFEEHSKANRIPVEYKDISSHKDWSGVNEAVKLADEIVKRKQLEKETKKLYVDDEWLVIIPETYESSQLYANNTKWCITQKSYWNDYKKSSRIIYVINKKSDDKYAISKRMSDNLIQGWDAKDKETSPLLWEFTDDIWKIIRLELKKSRQDIEIESLPEGMIYGSRNSVVPFETSSLKELELFYKKFGDFITPEFSERVIERGKELREEENKIKKSDSEIVKVSKLISNISYDGKYKDFINYNSNPYGVDLSDLLKSLDL
jgi:hypothetical protein